MTAEFPEIQERGACSDGATSRRRSQSAATELEAAALTECRYTATSRNPFGIQRAIPEQTLARERREAHHTDDGCCLYISLRGRGARGSRRHCGAVRAGGRRLAEGRTGGAGVFREEHPPGAGRALL